MSNDGARAQDAANGARPVSVRNRDILALTDVLCVMQEVNAIERRRDWQRERMYRITQHLNGAPGGGGAGRGLDEAFAQLSELDGEHEERCVAYVRKLRAAQEIIDGIPSQSMRTFVVMKYVMGVPDAVIRRELNMSERAFRKARESIEKAERMADVRWRERYILGK